MVKCRSVASVSTYSSVPENRNWQIETSLEFGWFLALCLRNLLAAIWAVLNDFLHNFLNDFLYENPNFLYKNLRFSL